MVFDGTAPSGFVEVEVPGLGTVDPVGRLIGAAEKELKQQMNNI